MTDLLQFYLTKEEPYRSCFITLRDLILKQDSNVSETRKYGMPCFVYKKKAFVYLWSDKKTGMPYILLVEGKHLDHPLLISGDRAKMKTLSVDPESDIPTTLIHDILNEALNLYRNGIIKA